MKQVVLRISKENAYFQHVETLRRRRDKRQKHREFFVEGVRPINQALKYNWMIKAFLYTREKPLSDWALHILEHSQAESHVELTSPLLEKLSNKTEPSELLAIIAMPADDLGRIPVKEHMLVVIFDRPASPGNLGSIIRSCDALQVDGLIITGHSVDLYDPETISASTGSFFALPTVRLSSHKDLQHWLAALQKRLGDVHIVGSDENASMALDTYDFTQSMLLVIGNETWGMSAAYRELCNTVVRIPIYGSASSLNVACATSIILYEIDRQRRLQP